MDSAHFQNYFGWPLDFSPLEPPQKSWTREGKGGRSSGSFVALHWLVRHRLTASGNWLEILSMGAPESESNMACTKENLNHIHIHLHWVWWFSRDFAILTNCFSVKKWLTYGKWTALAESQYSTIWIQIIKCFLPSIQMTNSNTAAMLKDYPLDWWIKQWTILLFDVPLFICVDFRNKLK